MSYPLDQILEVMKPSKPKNLLKFNALLDSDEYAAEEKIDGCHYTLIENRFFSTRISVTDGSPVEKTENLPHLVEAFTALNMPNLILDGEITIPGGKSQDVISVTGSLPDLAVHKQQENGYLHYMVFDILRVPGGRWLFDKTWEERRDLLEILFKYIHSEYIHLSPVVYDNKKQLLEEILARGGEGIVLKHKYSLYYPGKRPMWNWVKYKAEDEDDVVIVGFDPPSKEYTGTDYEKWPYWDALGLPVTRYFHLGWIGAIQIGKYKDGKLIRVGTCSGFDDLLRQEFSQTPDNYIGRVIKIKCMERTPDGAYRHPSFVSFHDDKNPKECVL